MRASNATYDTANCVTCSPCRKGEYLSRLCTGATFVDDKVCVACAYGSNGTAATGRCTLASTFLVDECVSGRNTFDRSNCSACNNNCVPANYSAGIYGQYIAQFCSSLPNASDHGNNVCGNCDGPCQAFDASRPLDRPGQYIASPCTGLTTSNRQCVDCRTSCPNADEFINGTCNGLSTNGDTSVCTKCKQQPSPYHYTLNACNGRTRSDQVWLSCNDRCSAGEYISQPCTNSSQTQCSACKVTCPAGHYKVGSCGGTTRYDSVQCIPCRQSCPAGQYRSGVEQCAFGNITIDPVVCKPCRSQCLEGEYIFGVCSGTGSFDETSCKQCTVCPRDKPSSYNSIYRSCNGSDSQVRIMTAIRWHQCITIA